MIAPLLIAGILIGHIIRTKKANIDRRLTALGSLLGGTGNAVNAAILYLFQNQATMQPNSLHERYICPRVLIFQ